MARRFVLGDEQIVAAPLERCFLLSTSLALVARELKMKPVRGRTHGLVVAGDTVYWRGRKFGLPQFHESLIEDFQPYRFFRDRMISGRFGAFEHDHAFLPQPDGTVLMRDEVRFSMRWGLCGDVIGAALLLPHIRRLMRRRFALLKRVAESDEWRRYLTEPVSIPSGS
ncbi:hypothetical protein DYQ86_25975 [Acidobacteria bacterium AB60]|nr:hypothetical protein DYQ86_25975 [Acidobacteria bacterium AB60]